MSIRLLGFDVETTGLCPTEDRVIESGMVLWDVETHTPLVCASHLLWGTNFPPVTPEITQITGIYPRMLEEFGCLPLAHWRYFCDFVALHEPDFIVAHNAPFDRKFLHAELARAELDIPDIPWIDTLTDIVDLEGTDSMKLKYLASDHGFINPFKHRAMFDVLTMLTVLDNYDIDKVIADSKIPEIVIRVAIPGPWKDGGVGKDKARANGFRWEKIGDVTYPKSWVKKIKENRLEIEKERLNEYEIEEIKSE